jgi:hypothetical protein
MTAPTKRVITDHLERAGATKKQATTWGAFLHGLDWDTIKPLTQIAVTSHVHPALAAGMVIRTTQDDTIKTTLTAHLETKTQWWRTTWKPSPSLAFPL